MNRCILPVLLIVGTLGGCALRSEKLGYTVTTQLQPISLLVVDRYDRVEPEAAAASARKRLQSTGVFSFINDGLGQTGYSLRIQEVVTPTNVLTVFGAMTLYTLPIPTDHEARLQVELRKHGELLKTYRYQGEGFGVYSWMLPNAMNDTQDELLRQFLDELQRDRLIPSNSE